MLDVSQQMIRKEAGPVYGHEGWGVAGWWAMGVGMLLFWGLVAVAIFAVIRLTDRGRDRRDTGQVAGQAPEQIQGQHSGGRSEALRVLDERFARGDIDEEEYRRRRDVLSER